MAAKKVKKSVAKKSAKKTAKKSVEKKTVKAKAKSAAKKTAKSQVKKTAKPVKAPTTKVAAKPAAPQNVSKPSKVTKASGEVALVPSRDGVLVERVVESDRTPGGLFIPTTALEKPSKGIVVSTGKGKFSKRGKLRPLDVQPGDEVMFGKYAGTEITIEGKQYLLIREDEILGVVS